jgi:hypothetical protein
MLFGGAAILVTQEPNDAMSVLHRQHPGWL